MCGIGAILDPAGTSGQHAAERMVEALRHRGPDGDAIRRIGPVTLAHTRLAIIDVAGGDQPLVSEDGATTLIANGEIYNHRSLRTGLEQRGHRFATRSDSEVILHAYEEFGPDGVSKLPAASTLIAEEGAAPRVETWRDPPGDPHRDLTDHDLGDLLAERFTDAVERQMMSDVPYGAFLSGGVDSAAVVAAMAKRSSQPPSTFTIGFPGHGGLVDERAPAAESARLIGTDHHDTAMVETDFLAELHTAMPPLEEPCGIPSAPALAHLSRFAAQEVKVVLAGKGAPEAH